MRHLPVQQAVSYTHLVEGLDAGRKVAIMASIAFHSRVVFPNVFTEGITKITAKDIEYAKEFDSVIKLLGVAHNTCLLYTSRAAGRQVMIMNMKKNKKFQKEQLAEQGFTDITECYRDSVDNL